MSKAEQTEQTTLTEYEAVRQLTQHMTKTSLRHLERALAEIIGLGLSVAELFELVKEVNVNV